MCVKFTHISTNPSGGELDSVLRDLEASWMRFSASKPKDRPEAVVEFTRLAPETCLSLWARFNPALMVGGLGVNAFSLLLRACTKNETRGLPVGPLVGSLRHPPPSQRSQLNGCPLYIPKFPSISNGVTLSQFIYILWGIRRFWRARHLFCASQTP